MQRSQRSQTGANRKCAFIHRRYWPVWVEHWPAGSEMIRYINLETRKVRVAISRLAIDRRSLAYQLARSWLEAISPPRFEYSSKECNKYKSHQNSLNFYL